MSDEKTLSQFDDFDDFEEEGGRQIADGSYPIPDYAASDIPMERIARTGRKETSSSERNHATAAASKHQRFFTTGT